MIQDMPPEAWKAIVVRRLSQYLRSTIYLYVVNLSI